MTTTSPSGPARTIADRPAYVSLSSPEELRASQAPLGSGPAPSDPKARRAMPLMRKVEIACLDPRAQVQEAGRLVPAVPAFEEAFSAFARGTLFMTDRGLVAVEDLWPGAKVRVADGSLRTLLWRGSTMVVPEGQGQDPVMTRLTRIAAEGLGFSRPMHDLVLGPWARLVQRRPGVRALTGREAAAVPASDFADGVTIVRLSPAAPVPVFHLGFERHERLIANGIEVESYHPGPLHAFPLRGDLLELFLSCFPHLSGLSGFGEPGLPRLALRDLDLFDAA